MHKSIDCGSVRKTHLGQEVTLAGWVHRRRDHGNIIFLDIRDRAGLIQVVFDPASAPEAHNIAESVRNEWVLKIKGMVSIRPEGTINTDMPTGDVEVLVRDVNVMSRSKTPPFYINEESDVDESIRLRYRYMDLRRPFMQEVLVLRHRVVKFIRNFLDSHNFIEIETPILMKSTPEGARDFLVPSRLHKGKFYALPQSPQTYKQLLMVSGFDRYFQIVKCFRDEDFRADRQPEFTQIDIEMSFVDQDDVIKLGTQLIRCLWKETLGVNLPDNFQILTYADCMETYGSDKPDMRFGMPLIEFKDYIENSDFDTFKTILKSEGRVKAIKCSNASSYSRKVIDELTVWLKNYHHAKGLAWMKCKNKTLEGGISKFFDSSTQNTIIQDLSVKNDDILFLIGDSKNITLSALGALRLKLAQREELIDHKKWAPLWVVDFPLVEWNEENNRWDALHHPFTSPNSEDESLINKEPGSVRSLGYDIVMNGYELGGGSIRIYNAELQSKIFDLLGIDRKEAEEKFGFLMNAFKYGAPPHGGMAFGLDRIIMLLEGSSQIRDVIAFPKTTSAMSLMDNSPSNVDRNQLDELGLKLK